MMATTNADLNIAEAVRVETDVRAQVPPNDNGFHEVHAGNKERLHDNTLPRDAKGTNLVVSYVSDMSPIVCHFVMYGTRQIISRLACYLLSFCPATRDKKWYVMSHSSFAMTLLAVLDIIRCMMRTSVLKVLVIGSQDSSSGL